MNRTVFAALLLTVPLAALLAPAPAAAQERILSYDSKIEIRADGSLDVTERITVRAEGRQIRRGIFRDFPTRYRDRYGNRVRVDFEPIGVERDGRTEAWFTERMSNGIRINTGNDDFLPVPADYTFILRYRTSRQLGFFDSHDELYWNSIGTGWVFPIDRGGVEVRLPEPLPIERMGAEGYTGPQGAQGAAYVAELAAPGVARYRLTQPLAAREGFTIVLTFPKGVIAEPTTTQRGRWFLGDNRGALIALAGLIALLVFCAQQWRRVGRDPRKGVIIPRYQPRDGQTPAGLRYMRRMGYDMRCFSCDVLAMAVGGHLSINRDKRLLKDEWRLDRVDASPARQVSALPAPADEASARPTWTDEPSDIAPPLASSQRALLERLFPAGKRELELKTANATTVSAAREAHRKALDHAFHPRYFKRNAGSVSVATAIAVLTGGLAFLASGGFGIAVIAVAVAAMAATVIVFARLVRAPTDEGRALLDEIEGLKQYMTVAERDELARMPGPEQPPPLDATRYETLLPFAVALDVEDAWTKKFTAAVGAAAAAAATSGITWYSGPGPVTNLGDFSRAIGSSLSSQISAASSPPGSSSGSGGGGSSGGGGGGGGGGGR